MTGWLTRTAAMVEQFLCNGILISAVSLASLLKVVSSSTDAQSAQITQKRCPHISQNTDNGVHLAVHLVAALKTASET